MNKYSRLSIMFVAGLLVSCTREDYYWKMKVKTIITISMLVLILMIVTGSLSTALGQGQHRQGAAHHAAPPPAKAEPASTPAFRAANARMHEAMNIVFTGNADVDFVKGMIPHHKGAIEMAQVVLKYGQDPGIKALAEAIITAQQEEIAQMRAWLKERGHSE